jgi:transposase
MITPEQHAEIRRLYYDEHWKVGTIAAALGVHHDTVRAAIAHDTPSVRRGMCRATKLDPYLPVIRDTLTHYPRLRATRLFEMVKARGYTGSVVQLRRAVRLIRPAATATVYRRLTTLAAEEAQVDWGAFGSIRIGRGVRPLSGFVMVLSYSRAVFALFTVDQTLESFLRGHVEAFQAFHGSARTLVYDNLRDALKRLHSTAADPGKMQRQRGRRLQWPVVLRVVGRRNGFNCRRHRVSVPGEWRASNWKPVSFTWIGSSKTRG